MNVFTNIRRERIAKIAEELAAKPLIGNEQKYGPDLVPILRYFPREDPEVGFDWCAAFVCHCCLEAGLVLPVRHPADDPFFIPERGDLIIFDNLLGNGPNDHIGVVTHREHGRLITAEGNYLNRSGIFDRTKAALTGFIRIADTYEYKEV